MSSVSTKLPNMLATSTVQQRAAKTAGGEFMKEYAHKMSVVLSGQTDGLLQGAFGETEPIKSCYYLFHTRNY